MKSRLITALAIGALSVGMLPGITAAADPIADGTSVITVTVDLGSTVIAPADFSVGSARPGVSTTSGSQTLTWWSNEAALKNIYLTMGADLVAAPGGQTIAMYDVSISKDAGTTWTALATRPANSAQRFMLGDILSVATKTNENADTQPFLIRVFVPQAAAEDYTATLNIAAELN